MSNWNPPKNAPKGYALSFRPPLEKRTKARRLRDRAWGLGDRRGHAVRAMPCISVRGMLSDTRCGPMPGRHGIEASHATARGKGGVNGGSGDLVPQCPQCHDWYGRDPSGYIEATGVSPKSMAFYIKHNLDDELGVEPCYLCDAIGDHSPMCKTAEALELARESG